MENSIRNIAVISIPRSGSRSLVDYYCKKFNKKPAYGVLHTPIFLGKNEYNVKEIVESKNYVLHGHWHTLENLDIDTKMYIKNHYKIATINRNLLEVKQSVKKIVYNKSIMEENEFNILFQSLIKESINTKSKWKIDYTWNFNNFINLA